MAAGVFNTNLSSALGGKGGLNFALQQGNRGALSVVQVNYLFQRRARGYGFARAVQFRRLL